MARSAGVARKDVDRAVERAVFAEPLEATYIFPLPPRAAVTGFRMTVNDTVVEGRIDERGQARDDYDAAIAAGRTASIAEQERADVFTLRVGNIPPTSTARIELTLAAPVAIDSLEATYRFPLVVAPRYCPGTALDGDPVGDGILADTDLVPDASRISPLVAIDPRQPDRAIAPKSLRRIVQPVERAWPASQSCAAPDVYRTMCSMSPPPPPSMDDLARYFSAEEDDPGTTGFLDAARVEARRILVKARPWWGSIGWLTARKVGNLLTAVRQLLDSPAVARAPRQSIQALTIAYARLHAMPADRNAIVALLDALADIALLPETADRWWRTSAVGRNPRGEVPAEHRRRS